MVVFSYLLVIVEVSSGFTRGSDSFTGAFSLLGIWYRLLEVAGSLGGEVGSAAAFRALASVSRFELLNTTTSFPPPIIFFLIRVLLYPTTKQGSSMQA